MGAEVYANGNAIACKKSDDKVIAAFPDVCLSPPSPPAGPLPIPYPNTSFSKDMKNGSKTVKIGGGEVMLKDQSYYKSSPLGDEAATRSFGANLLSHSITGKTYFAAWSMDVKFEGENVDRHLDLTTSNHSSYPAGVAVPMPAMEKLALDRIAENKCPCCGGESHVAGENPPPAVMNMEEWYHDTASRRPRRPQGTPQQKQDYAQHLREMRKLLRDSTPEGRKTLGCYCNTLKPETRKRDLLPSPPCDVFFQKPANTEDASARTDQIAEEYNANRPAWQKKMEIAEGSSKNKRSGNHLTPKSAGGCPGSAENDGNLQAKRHLCSVCQSLDEKFSKFQ